MVLLKFLAQIVLSLLAVLALLFGLALAGDDQVIPAVAAVYICCWAVQKAHGATNVRRQGGRHV